MLPGEAVATALLNLITQLIEGQTPEQKAKIWQQWIEFWQPVVDLMTVKK